MNKKEQIRQLLELAANTPFPAEAQLAQERAEKLMVRYNIDQATLLDQNPTLHSYTSKKYYMHGIYSKALHYGLYWVIDAFNSTVALEGHTKNQQYCWVSIYGSTPDVDAMMELCASLQSQAIGSMKFWWKENKTTFQWYSNYQQRLIRESYINHFFDGAVSRIKEVVSQGVEETGSQELVVSHRQKAQDYLDSLVPNIKTKGYKRNLFEEAYSGYKAGYNVNLSGKNLDKTKQKQLG